MKLKNTLGLYIGCMIGNVSPAPVIGLRVEVSSSPWYLMLQIVVGGWVVGGVTLDRFETSNGMLALKHRETYGQYSGHHSLTSDCLSVGLSPTQIKLLNNGRSGVGTPIISDDSIIGMYPLPRHPIRPWTVVVGNNPLGKDLALSFPLEPKEYQRPFVNVGTVGHCDFGGGFRRGDLVALAAKHEYEFRLPKDRDLGTKKFYFDPNTGLNKGN